MLKEVEIKTFYNYFNILNKKYLRSQGSRGKKAVLLKYILPFVIHSVKKGNCQDSENQWLFQNKNIT